MAISVFTHNFSVHTYTHVYVHIYVYTHILHKKIIYVYVCVLSSNVSGNHIFGEPPKVTQKAIVVSSPLPLRLSWAGQNPRVRPATKRHAVA